MKKELPPPPAYKKKSSKSKIALVSFLAFLGLFLVLNHFAAIFVICSPLYKTPYLCDEIGNYRLITYAPDLSISINQD